MKKLAKKNFEYIVYVAILLAIGIVFFFYLGEPGYVLEKDSGVFLEKKVPKQYVVYPVFLELCQIIFGKEHYLEWVSNIQGFFSLIVSFITAEYFRKNYKLSYIWGAFVFLFTFGPYAYSLPQYVSSHSIMTEGLAFPLFYLWMLCALQVYLKNNYRWFLPLFLMTIIMACTRPQLMLFLIICFVMVVERAIVCVYHRVKEYNRKIFIRICIFIGIVFCLLGVKTFFVFLQNNIYPQMTDSVAGRIFCAAEEADEKLFVGRDKDLFVGIFDEIETMESREPYFRNGIRKWEDIVQATNDNTKMLGWIIRSYYTEIKMERLNDVKGQLAYTMMLEHWDDYLSMTMVLMLQSLVVSIFVHPESAYLLGFIIAIILYLFALFFAVLCKRIYHVEQKYLIPLILTLFVILAVCGITNILFMGIQRYVVYPFGFFYISLLVLYYGANKNYKHRNAI